MDSVIGYIVAVFGALGVREILAMITKSRLNKQEREDDREDKLLDQSQQLLKETLDELKNELKEKREIENELREKVSDCTARLDMIMRELTNENNQTEED